jgi:hypothetical protein
VVLEPHTEILAGGRDEQLTGVVWHWLRHKPRLVALLIVLALAAAGLVVVRALRDPGLPQLVVEGTADSSPVAAPWQAGWDGRPRSPVILSVTATVRRLRPQKGQLSVTGIAGPGVVHAESAPIAVPERGEVKVPLRADVDCSRLPLTVPNDAFGLRITTRDGPRSHTGVVSAGQPGRGWAHAVQLACATWIARRDLTVSTLRARVHPTLPRADLTMTFVNNGPRTAVVEQPLSAFPDVAVQGPFPLRVPPLASVTAQVSLTLDRCDVVASLVYSAIGSPTISSRINLVAIAGPYPKGQFSFEGPGEGGELTGVVLAPPAGKALGSALTQACAGLGPVVSQIPPGGVRYDAAHRDMSVTVGLGVAPGRVRTLSLQPNTRPLHQDGLVALPAWTTTPEVRPDANGQARVTIHFRTPGADPCPSLGATLLGAVATLRVPGSTGERVLKFSLFLDMAQDTRAVAELCGDASSVQGDRRSAGYRRSSAA